MTENILENKMSNYTNSIRLSLEYENWYAALTLALTLPDICGKLEFPHKSSSARFIHWFNNYLLDKYTKNIAGGSNVFLSGQDAYALRCAYLHQGEVNIEGQRIRKVLSEFSFYAPPKYSYIHCNKMNNSLQLQVDIFCMEVCNAVELWVKDVSSDHLIQGRAKKLMTIHSFAPIY